MFDQIADDSKEEETDEQGPTRLTAFYIAVSLVPVIVLFSYLGKFNLGLNVFLLLSVNTLAIRTHWQLRNYYWLWLAIFLVMTLELPVVLLTRWPHHWVPAVVLLPIAVAAYFIASGAIQFAEKLLGKSASH